MHDSSADFCQVYRQRLGHFCCRLPGHLHSQLGCFHDHTRRVLRSEWCRRSTGILLQTIVSLSAFSAFVALISILYWWWISLAHQPEKSRASFSFRHRFQHSHGGDHFETLQRDALPHAKLQSQRNQGRYWCRQKRVSVFFHVVSFLKINVDQPGGRERVRWYFGSGVDCISHGRKITYHWKMVRAKLVLWASRPLNRISTHRVESHDAQDSWFDRDWIKMHWDDRWSMTRSVSLTVLFLFRRSIETNQNLSSNYNLGWREK